MFSDFPTPQNHQPSRPEASIASTPPIVLAIAGYDPSAGAGVLADLKTFAAHGVYGMACVTALTVQSTKGVRRVEFVDPAVVGETLACLAEDVRFSAIKVGMLGNGTVAKTVADWLERTLDRSKEIPVVLDPVLKSSSGKDLLDTSGWDMLRKRLLARVDWITPNREELAVLTGKTIPQDRAETERLGRRLLEVAALKGNSALKIVITGGDVETPEDLLLTGEICEWFADSRIHTKSTHGTGCAFSSALASNLALGGSSIDSVKMARNYVRGALLHAETLGQGAGPLNHFWEVALNHRI